MKKLLKRLLVIILCVAMLVNSQSISVSASEPDETEYSEENGTTESEEVVETEGQSVPTAEDEEESIQATADASETEATSETLSTTEEETEELELQASMTEEQWRAGFYGGTGTEENPYTIINPAQLKFFNENFNNYPAASVKYYKLGNSIDFGGEEWTPLVSKTIYGFDGNKHTISNIKIVADDSLGSSSIAMFSSVNKLTDLTVDNVEFVDSRTDLWTSIDAAVLCLRVDTNQKMERCKVSGDITISSEGTQPSSISGLVYYNSGVIDNCTFSGNITYDRQVSGIANSNKGTINNCKNEGTLKGTGEGWLAGITLSNNGKVTECENKGVIEYAGINCYAAGIVYENKTGAEISYCDNNGEMSGTNLSGICSKLDAGKVERCNNTGNLSGKNVCAIVNSMTVGQLLECTNSGKLTGEDAYGIVSGCVGSISILSSLKDNIVISKCKNSGEIVSKGKAAGILCELNMRVASSNYTIKLDQCANTGSITANGAGAAGIAYTISSQATLQGIISLDKCSNNGSINSPDGRAAGIVGSTTGEVILTECANEGTIDGNYASGIIGSASPYSRVYSLDSNEYPHALIKRCYNHGDITALPGSNWSVASAGGIAQELASATVECCYNTGKVTADYPVGGIAARANVLYGALKIADCYNSGDILARKTSSYKGDAAGLVVELSGASKYDCSVTNCYNVGSVKCAGDTNSAGQLFGCVSGFGNQSDYKINYCYYSKDNGTNVAKTDTYYGEWDDYAGMKGVTTEELMDQDTFEGFDFGERWSMGDEEYPYPVLSCIGAGDTFRISYRLYGGKNNSKNISKFTQDDEITLYPASREGYVFLGWYTDAEYSEKITTISGSIRKNITVYAKWAKGDEVIDTVTINGSGYAYLWGILYDDDGTVLKGSVYRWSLYDVTNPNNETYITGGLDTSVDEDGSYCIKTPKLVNDTKTDTLHKLYKIKLEVPNGNTMRTLGYNITTDVAIAPFTFTQSWDLGYTAGGGASFDLGVDEKQVGEATIEAKLAGLGLDGNVGNRVSVERELSGNVQNIVIKETYSAKIGGNFSFGPELKTTVGNKEYDAPVSSVGMGVSFGSTISPGLVLENYDPNNKNHVDRLGAYLLNSAAIASGDVLLTTLVDVMDFNGVKYVNTLSNGYTYAVNGNSSISDKLSGFGGLGVSSSYSAARIYSYGESSRLDKMEETKFTSFKVDRNLDTAAAKKILGIKSKYGAGFGSGDSFTISAPHDSLNDVPNVNWVSFTVSNTNSSALSFIIGNDQKTITEKTTISYADADALKICQDVDAIGSFAYGDTRYVLDSEHSNIIDQVNNSEAVGSYKVTDESAHGEQFSISIPISGLSLKMGCAGSYEESYTAEKGTYIKGEARKYTESDGSLIASANVMDITQILVDPLEYYYNQVKSTLGEAIQYIGEKSEYVIKKADSTVKVIRKKISEIEPKKYTVHLFTSKNEGIAVQSVSYEVQSLDSNGELKLQAEDNSNETVATVGYPYLVYLVDESEEVAGLAEDDRLLDAFPEGDECTITIKYSLEDLQAAGITSINGGHLCIYKYIEESQGYECLGGNRDYENNSVSVGITEPGQFILAVDDDMPVVKDIVISDASATPEIVIYIEDKSGFGDISLKIDDREVVNIGNYKSYYSVKDGKLTYKLSEAEALEDGMHTVSIYAVDGAGNGMTTPLTKEFAVRIGRAEIETAHCFVEGKDIRIRANFKKFDAAFDDSVYLDEIDKILASVTEIHEVEGSEPEVTTTEFELGMAGKNRYITGVGDRKYTDGDIIKYTITIKYTDGREAVKEFSKVDGTGEIRIGDATNDLWYYIPTASVEYTGAAIKPVVYVFDGDKLLVEKKDYTLSYTNNVNASKYEDGTVSTKTPCIIVTGRGNYSQKDSIDFEIVQKDITASDVVIDDVATALSTGKPQKPVAVITWGKKKLANNKDFVISYCQKNDGVTEATFEEETVIPKEIGEYFVLIRAKEHSNYKGQSFKTFTIADKNTCKLIRKVTVKKIKDIPYFDEKTCFSEPLGKYKPDMSEIIVNDGKTPLVYGEDYTVSFSVDSKKYKDAGTEYVTIIGKGKYVGTKTVSYKITGNPISKISSCIWSVPEWNDASTYYFGEEVKFRAIEPFYNGTNNSEWKLKAIEKVEYDKLSDDEKQAYQCVYEYKNNNKPGTANVIFYGVNGYVGTCKRNFKIKKWIAFRDSYNDETDGCIWVTSGTYPHNKYVYDYSYPAVKPRIYVECYGNMLTEGKDYTVSYTNNKVVTNGKPAYYKVTFKGDFGGSTSNYYIIKQADIEKDGIKATAADKVFADKKGAWKSPVTVTTSDGLKVSAKNHYSTKFVYTYEKFVADDGSETETCDNIKNVKNAKNPTYVTRTKGDTVDEFDIVPAGTVIRVTVQGEGNYKGSIDTTYRVVKNDINKLTVVINDGKPFAYSTRDIRLNKDDIVFKKGREVLTDVTYEIDETSYKNNINKGKASVVLKGYGDYGGSKTVTYTISNKQFKWGIMDWFKK